MLLYCAITFYYPILGYSMLSYNIQKCTIKNSFGWAFWVCAWGFWGFEVEGLGLHSKTRRSLKSIVKTREFGAGYKVAGCRVSW